MDTQVSNEVNQRNIIMKYNHLFFSLSLLLASSSIVAMEGASDDVDESLHLKVRKMIELYRSRGGGFYQGAINQSGWNTVTDIVIVEFAKKVFSDVETDIQELVRTIKKKEKDKLNDPPNKIDPDKFFPIYRLEDANKDVDVVEQKIVEGDKLWTRLRKPMSIGCIRTSYSVVPGFVNVRDARY